jgi:hypothetical protein
VGGVDSRGADASHVAATTNATTTAATAKNPNFMKKVKKFTLKYFSLSFGSKLERPRRR